MTKLIITLSLIFSVMHISSLLAEDLVIAAGKEGGGYHKKAEEIAVRLEQRGHDVEVVNYNGSDEITLAMCKGEAQIGIGQIDAVDARRLEGCRLHPTADYGTELSFLLFPPGTKKRQRKLHKLDESNFILVDTIGSGSDLFWRTIVRIENSEDGNGSDWAKVSPVHEMPELATSLANFGEIDGLLLVRLPSSPDIINLLDDGWRLGELYDKDINDYVFNNASLYEAQAIKVKGKKTYGGGSGYKVKSFILTTAEVKSDRTLFTDIVRSSKF